MTNIAILGCGGIARKMARTLRMMRSSGEPVRVYAAAARDLSRAQAFCREEDFERAYGSYEEMLRDPQVQLVYIATPHSHHYEHMLLCLEHGKHVLCEKAFTLNASQAREVLRLSHERQLLVAEAMWTRYQPARSVILELIDEIGPVEYIAADIHYQMEQIPRIRLPELAGGALLDIGVYAINFALMYMGSPVVRVGTSAQLTELGVDRQESMTLWGENGCIAVLSAGIAANAGQRGVIAGKKGAVTVDSLFNPSRITLTVDGKTREVPIPEQMTGYEYQVRACLRALENGSIECPEMPHAQTLRMMELMDQLRRSWGMVYPQERGE